MTSLSKDIANMNRASKRLKTFTLGFLGMLILASSNLAFAKPLAFCQTGFFEGTEFGVPVTRRLTLHLHLNQDSNSFRTTLIEHLPEIKDDDSRQPNYRTYGLYSKLNKDGLFQGNANNDYIPGGNAQYNLDVEVDFSKPPYWGKMTLYTYPKGDGSGGYGQGGGDIVTKGQVYFRPCLLDDPR